MSSENQRFSEIYKKINDFVNFLEVYNLLRMFSVHFLRLKYFRNLKTTSLWRISMCAQVCFLLLIVLFKVAQVSSTMLNIRILPPHKNLSIITMNIEKMN